MGGFDGTFGTIVHASHTTFATVGPKRTFIYGNNGFNRTIPDTNITIVARSIGIKRFCKNKSSDKEVA